jgi:uncharacterized protein (DUF427 family)
MDSRAPKLPGADHPISVTPGTQHVIVSAGGQVIADSRHALLLREASYPVVHYIPRTDATMELLEPTTHKTYCPYKGECSYFSIVAGGKTSVNAVWSYQDPYPAVAAIKGHLAFYRDRVDLREEST